jgi:hypothetical protein
MAGKAAADDSSLKRLGGGRWQTRDERFTIEPESGTWVVVDAEQTDDLGLPLVRGPFRSLGDAKDAIAAARSSPPEASPLADRIGRRQTEAAGRQAKTAGESKVQQAPTAGRRSRKETEPAATTPKHAKAPVEPEEPAEPRWFAALEPEDRRRARRLIARLEDAGAPDPEGMARRDIVGEVPAVAAFAIERKLDGLGSDADPAEVAGLLAEGRDDDLGVRWRLVDDSGRPIAIDLRRPRVSRGR